MTDMQDPNAEVDLFIIGGGINGCGIARDAAGRGLMVALAEMGDLAQATSSSSTKLFHGGLRYLEYFEIGLVRKALIEREVLLRAMPHISWPMRFVLPYHEEMRFEGDTPTSKLLSVFIMVFGVALFVQLARAIFQPKNALYGIALRIRRYRLTRSGPKKTRFPLPAL